MAQSADELLTAIKSYAKGMIKGNTVDTLGAPVDILNETIVKPGLNLIGAGKYASDAPVGGSKSLRKLFGQPVEDANIAETVGSMVSAAGALKAIIVPAFLTKSIKQVKKAEQALNEGTDAAQVEKYTGIFRLPEHIDDGVLRAVIDPSYVNLRPGVTNAAGTELASGVIFKLPEVLDFPQLYKAAPFTKEIMIGHNPGYDPGVASFNSGANYIALGPQRDQMEIIQSVLHETQHGVQNKYNMNTGSNPWLFMTDPDKFREAQKVTLASKEYAKFETLNDAYRNASAMYKKSAGEAEARAVETMQRGTMQSGRPALSYYGDDYEINRMIRGHEEARKVDNDPVIQQIIRDALASKKSNP